MMPLLFTVLPIYCAFPPISSAVAFFAYNNFKIIGVAMEDTIISKITDVKYTEESSPTENPFWETISATSPRVIIPTPIFKESGQLNLHALAVRPQPMIFAIRATATNPIEKANRPQSRLSILVFRPMDAKKIGPKSI